jgi:hypothetical protein
MTTNATIERLDRAAAKIGFHVQVNKNNNRQFRLSEQRVIRYRPGGKGVVRAEVYVDGQLDVISVCQPERMERLFVKALKWHRDQPWSVS